MSDQLFEPGASARHFDWLPDVADHRDFNFASRRIVPLLARLNSPRKKQEVPPQVDWRAYVGPVPEPAFNSAVESCVAMFQYFERRASGRLLQLSRSFLAFNANRVSESPNRATTFRAVLKAAKRCGIPPEKHWPAERAPNQVPDPFTYCFRRYFGSIRYLRLDGPQATGEESLGKLRALLAAGFTAVFGFPECGTLGDGPDIAFPTALDDSSGGTAAMAIGYDDGLRIRSDKGALLIRSNFGPNWGDGGYGWLPYAYVRQRLATDFWTLIKPSWVRSGEFELPTL